MRRITRQMQKGSPSVGKRTCDVITRLEVALLLQEPEYVPRSSVPNTVVRDCERIPREL